MYGSTDKNEKLFSFSVPSQEDMKKKRGDLNRFGYLCLYAFI